MLQKNVHVWCYYMGFSMTMTVVAVYFRVYPILLNVV